MIRLSHVSKTFDQGESFVVRDVSLEVKDGETLVLLGTSGCGKTTTLKMINRLIEPTSGSIVVDNEDVLSQDVTQLRRSMGYVFQSIGLFPHMSVEENITVVMQVSEYSPQARHARARDLLETVNLAPDQYLRRYPAELSGGQRQRVAVARALAMNPNYLLMDEPFGALDALTRKAMQSELVELRNKLNKTIVFVTHDIFEAMTLGDRIAVMNAGRIEQIGTLQILLEKPASPFVKSLFATVEHTVAQYRQETRESHV